jgi:hypothetical protein
MTASRVVGLIAGLGVAGGVVCSVVKMVSGGPSRGRFRNPE